MTNDNILVMADTGKIVIKVSGLHKHYREGEADLHILRGVNLEVRSGERIAITGLSGSGKSTLLHMLAGLDKPDKGEIFVSGQNIHHLDEKQLCKLRNRSLGFIYQFHHLLAEFTALENTAMPLLIRGTNRKQANILATEMLDRVGLAHRMQHIPAKLSGGERQRVAIARALVATPDCILADEPTGNLDEETASQVNELMLQLSKELTISFVVVTHNLALASHMDRCCELHNGIIQTRDSH